MRQESPQDVLLSTLFARYYQGHAKDIASADTTLRSLNTWIEFYGAAAVSDLTVPRQEEFIAWLRARGLKDGYIKRMITAGKAALNYAYKRQEIAAVPYIFTVPDSEPAERVLSLKEMAALFNATKPGTKDFMYLIIAFNTLARPAAVLDLAPRQVNLKDRLVDLLVPGTKQTKKRRPILPITNTLLPWLQTASGENFVNYHGKQIASNKKAFAGLVTAAKIKTGDVTRNTIRHSVATEMRRRGVDVWEIEGWLGHRLPSTSERYAKYSADYLSDGRKAIDAMFDDLQPLVKYPLRFSCVPVVLSSKLKG